MKKRVQRLILGLFFVALISGYTVNAFSEKPGLRLSTPATQTTVDNCLACHRKNKDEVIDLFARSTHARRKLSCNACHGGDPAATAKPGAHTGHFIGKPSAGQILEMCSACHQTQLAAFKASRHIQEDGKTARVDCAQCHGAHLIGSLANESNFALLCSNCHGLEYLPQLPNSLRHILTVNDEVKNALSDLQNSGRKASDSLINKRRELRETIADIVHSTNAQSASTQEQKIVELSQALKQQIQSEKQQ